MSAIDNEQFTSLVKEYTPNLYRLALGILHNHEDARDVVAESVLKAYEKIHTLKNPEKFRAWIMSIAANEAKRTYAKNKKSAPMEDVSPYMPEFEDEHHELWAVVMGIDVVYREVIILYFYEQLTIKEISKILHIPEGTVKSRLYRGKQELKKRLEKGD